jgi:hypothetical protein
MHLTNDEIRLIAEWEPIQEGFGRDDDRTGIRIRDIAKRINSGDFRCRILEEDGLSNYFVLLAFNIADAGWDEDLQWGADGLLVYLSACAPVGVVGRSHLCRGSNSASHGQLEIEKLISPDQLGDPLGQKVVEALYSGGYQLLSVEEVSRPLPPGVEPYEYCFSSEPWDRVFHALFGNTD